jgi:hypothetical protein
VLKLLKTEIFIATNKITLYQKFRDFKEILNDISDAGTFANAMDWVYRVFGKFLSETVPFAVSFLLVRNFILFLLKWTMQIEPDFWQHHWERFVALNSDPMFYYLVCSFTSSSIFYWAWGGFYCLLDWTGWLSRYKVQPGMNQPPDRAKFAKVRLF